MKTFFFRFGRTIIYLSLCVCLTALILLEYTTAFSDRKNIQGTVEEVIIRSNYYYNIMNVKLQDGRNVYVPTRYDKVGDTITLNCFEGGLTGKLSCDYVFTK
ncbi:hypothetical protein TQ33_2166 [Kangiella geojedonensis]|uniref:Uncharacterized protein n=1 Tax=Kangiella geojedonensis TaxID=914150 RepID=A0A0F6TSU9_9GAMM|nr:hypothetical protein TQ33_2166 [Kangiella geojedonensis]